MRVHPRVCGEARPADRGSRALGGPSPRVRGSPRAAAERPVSTGSIPACAGKPRGSRDSPRGGGVHPRVCGEAEGGGAREAWRRGPSPRVRGSRAPSCSPRTAGGSIPACAGKPRRRGASRRGVRVHPRVCGEASKPSLCPRPDRGPSPRVRGSPSKPSLRTCAQGSIPACAGKPGSGTGTTMCEGVHPRVCGEATLAAVERLAARGPSPRVRGSRASARAATVRAGSIPACAGKPAGLPTLPARSWVHPRVCGEASVN